MSAYPSIDQRNLLKQLSFFSELSRVILHVAPVIAVYRLLTSLAQSGEGLNVPLLRIALGAFPVYVLFQMYVRQDYRRASLWLMAYLSALPMAYAVALLASKYAADSLGSFGNEIVICGHALLAIYFYRRASGNPDSLLACVQRLSLLLGVLLWTIGVYDLWRKSLVDGEIFVLGFVIFGLLLTDLYSRSLCRVLRWHKQRIMLTGDVNDNTPALHSQRTAQLQTCATEGSQAVILLGLASTLIAVVLFVF